MLVLVAFEQHKCNLCMFDLYDTHPTIDIMQRVMRIIAITLLSVWTLIEVRYYGTDKCRNIAKTAAGQRSKE
jgi:hypothetical protein